MHILISACLLGVPCRYDGASRPVPFAKALAERHMLHPICPEVLGGLPTPRSPAERQSDGTVCNVSGEDVTDAYLRGANSALAVAIREGCDLAILKERSPSCGKGKIYDGSFRRQLIDGDGVTAELLSDHGIRVIGETEATQWMKEKRL